MAWEPAKNRGNVINYFSGSSAITYTSTRAWASLTIINDSLLSALQFTVNNIQVTVKAGEVFDLMIILKIS